MELVARLSDGTLVFTCSEHVVDRVFSSALGHLKYEHSFEEQEARAKIAMAAYEAGLRDGKELREQAR